LTLREEYRLRVFENKMLRRRFGPKRDDIIRRWRRLHNEGIHNVCPSPNIIRMINSRRMRWVEHVASIEKKDLYTQDFGGKARTEETTRKT
jgi:hypothetical protein